jgi:hypothetical protein
MKFKTSFTMFSFQQNIKGAKAAAWLQGMADCEVLWRSVPPEYK